MAKINPTMGDISGSIGGLTFARNAYGAYVRRKVSPVQPETPDQTLIRERMTGLSKSWNDVLTAPERASWENLANAVSFSDVFGNPQKLSGIALRNKVGMQMLTAGDVPLAVAPADLDVTGLLSASLDSVTAGGNTFDVNFADVNAATDRIIIKGVVNVKPGVNFVEDKMRFMFASALNELSGFTVTMPAKFGVLILGATLVVRVIRYNSLNGAYSSGIVVKAVSTV